MNTVKFQDTKIKITKLLQIMKYQKNYKNNSIYNSIKNNKIVKNKPKEVKCCTLNITNPDERN